MVTTFSKRRASQGLELKLGITTISFSNNFTYLLQMSVSINYSYIVSSLYRQDLSRKIIVTSLDLEMFLRHRNTNIRLWPDFYRFYIFAFICLCLFLSVFLSVYVYLPQVSQSNNGARAVESEELTVCSMKWNVCRGCITRKKRNRR